MIGGFVLEHKRYPIKYNNAEERPKNISEKTTNRGKTVLKRSTKLTRVCLVRAIIMKDTPNSTNDNGLTGPR